MKTVITPALVDELTITVIIDNYYDGLLLPVNNVRRHGFLRPGGGELPPQIVAEHGFSCHIEINSGGERSALLMDFGVSSDGAARNIRALGVDLAGISAAILSHGHFDHYGGLESIMREMEEKKPIPLYVGEEAFLSRYIDLPGMRMDLGSLDREKVAASGCKIEEIEQAAEILPGVLVICPVPRVTEFEQGSPIMALERDGGIERDDFKGELSLAFNVAGKGLVILTACAHAGIVNIVRRAVDLTGMEKIHAILGGFHLSGAPPEKIEKTVEELARLNPDQIVPMHCTGFEAQKMIAGAMPESFVLYSAGSRYVYR